MGWGDRARMRCTQESAGGGGDSPEKRPKAPYKSTGAWAMYKTRYLDALADCPPGTPGGPPPIAHAAVGKPWCRAATLGKPCNGTAYGPCKKNPCVLYLSGDWMWEADLRAQVCKEATPLGGGASSSSMATE